jgi:hypothetical protein
LLLPGAFQGPSREASLPAASPQTLVRPCSPLTTRQTPLYCRLTAPAYAPLLSIKKPTTSIWSPHLRPPLATTQASGLQTTVPNDGPPPSSTFPHLPWSREKESWLCLPCPCRHLPCLAVWTSRTRPHRGPGSVCRLFQTTGTATKAESFPPWAGKNGRLPAGQAYSLHCSKITCCRKP